MYSKFSTFSDMGMSNSDIFLSEKDLEYMEFNFLVKPTLDFPERFHFSHSEDGDQEQEVQKQVQEEQREENCVIVISSLQIKVPSLGEFKNEEEDGFRTPTSLDQRIPLIPCPPAPRKPKTLPSSTKRKAPHRKILLDLSNEIQSFFSPADLVSDLGGNKIKKAREGHCTKS